MVEKGEAGAAVLGGIIGFGIGRASVPGAPAGVSAEQLKEIMSDAVLNALEEYDKTLAGPAKLFLEAKDFSTSSTSYIDLIDVTVPTNEKWELWYFTVTSDGANAIFNVQIGELNSPKDFQPRIINTDLIFLLPDRIALRPNQKFRVQVKSATGSVAGYVKVIGRKFTIAEK